MKTPLNYSIIIFSLLFLGIWASAAPQGGAEAPIPGDWTGLEAYLDGIMSVHMARNHIAGAVLAVVKDGEILLAKGYGFADVERQIRVSAERTLFRPGSVSKLITWTAVMQLVSEGKIDLKADVNTYLEDFAIPPAYDKPVTMAHLMSHTPGFEEVISGMARRRAEDLDSLEEYLIENIPARFLPPGTITAYSNYGAALAGYIVQEVSGQPFEQYVEEKIFAPLKMSHSTFRQPLPENLAADMSVGYRYRKGRFEASEFELLNGMYPAGSMSSTAVDMARFMIAHLSGGEYEGGRILSEEAAEQMHSRLFAHDPDVSGNAHGFFEMNTNGVRGIGHGGDTLLFHSLLGIMPDKNFGFFVSYNTESGGGAPRSELFQALMDRYFPLPAAEVLKPAENDPKENARFVGCYGLKRTVDSSFAKLMNLMMFIRVSMAPDGALMVRSPGGELSRWIRVSPLVFREVHSRRTLVFREDEKGGVTHLFYADNPYAGTVRLRGLENPRIHYILIAVVGLLFLSTLIWPLRALGRRICGGPGQQPEKRSINARWAAALMGLAGIFYLMGLIAGTSNVENVIFGLPLSVRLLFILPWIVVFLTVLVGFYVMVVWYRRLWTRCARIHYTLIFLAGLFYVWFLFYWKQVGLYFLG